MCRAQRVIVVFLRRHRLGELPTCAQSGVLGSVVGMLGAIQATEALRYIVGIGDLLINRLLIFNALNMNFRTVTFQKNPECKVCHV